MHFLCLIAVAFGVANAQLPTEKTCAACMHMSFTLGNVPAEAQSMLSKIFASLSDQDCLTSNAKTTTCSPSSQSLVSKCQVTTVYMTAVGLTNVSPEAKMNMSMVLKNCAPQPVGEPDKCTDFKDMDANMRQQMTAQMESIKQQWSQVDFQGNSCIGDGAVPPKVNPGTGRDPTGSATSTSISLMCFLTVFAMNLL